MTPELEAKLTALIDGIGALVGSIGQLAEAIAMQASVMAGDEEDQPAGNPYGGLDG